MVGSTQATRFTGEDEETTSGVDNDNAALGWAADVDVGVVRVVGGEEWDREVGEWYMYMYWCCLLY